MDSRLNLLESALGCGAGSNPFGSLQNLGFGAANQWNLGLSLQQNVFTGGRVTAQYRAANAGKRSAAIGLTAAKAQLTLDVTQAYYDAQLADRLVTIAAATLSQADTTLCADEARTAGGQRGGVRSAARAGDARQSGAGAHSAALRSRRRVRASQAAAPFAARRFGRAHDVARRLDGGARRHGVDAARAAARYGAPESRAGASGIGERAPRRRAPSPSRTRSGFRRSRSPRHSGAWRIRRACSRRGRTSGSNWTSAARCTLPIFTGGNIHGDEQIATAGLQQARAQLQQTRELAELDALNALNKLRAAQAQMDASRGTAEQAARAYQIATVRYKEGISTQTELNDSQIQLQQAEANRATAARDLQVARMRLALLRDLPLSGTSAQAAQAQTQSGAQSSALAVPLGTQSNSTSGQTGSGVDASGGSAESATGEHAMTVANMQKSRGTATLGLVVGGLVIVIAGVVGYQQYVKTASEGHGRHDRRRQRRQGRDRRRIERSRFVRDRRSRAR